MNREREFDRAHEWACLILLLVILTAYNEHATWSKSVRFHTVEWNISNMIAIGVLALALLVSAFGVCLSLIRTVLTIANAQKRRAFMVRPHSKKTTTYADDKWIYAGYSLLGFLSFGLTFSTLVVGFLLATFFRLAMTYFLTKQSVVKIVELRR